MTTAQLHSTKPELRFYAGSNPACGVSEIHDGKDLWQWFRLEIRLKPLSSVNHTTKTIHHHHHQRSTDANRTAQKKKFSIKDSFRKCDQIRRVVRIWSHLLKKSLMENFIFCAVSFLLHLEEHYETTKIHNSHFFWKNLF